MVTDKKRFYNRVRRTCLKDGQLLMGDYSDGSGPLDINWQRLHEDLTKYGFVGGAK
jgi:hypothetical protein